MNKQQQKKEEERVKSSGSNNIMNATSSTPQQTLLEEAVEGLSSLPVDIKRNFELMRELDEAFQDSLTELKQLQKAYLDRAKRKLKTLVESFIFFRCR